VHIVGSPFRVKSFFPPIVVVRQQTSPSLSHPADISPIHATQLLEGYTRLAEMQLLAKAKVNTSALSQLLLTKAAAVTDISPAVVNVAAG
jgi:hypothetical protein